MLTLDNLERHKAIKSAQLKTGQPVYQGKPSEPIRKSEQPKQKISLSRNRAQILNMAEDAVLRVIRESPDHMQKSITTFEDPARMLRDDLLAFECSGQAGEMLKRFLAYKGYEVVS